MSKKQRISGLDSLRGIAALLIVFYHYLTWQKGVGFVGYGSSNFFGIFGVYGVSIFYVLSGMTLSLIYHQRILGRRSVLDFFTKRFFRIFPLLWVVTIATLILNFHDHSLRKYF